MNDFFRFLWKLFQFRAQAIQGLIQSQKFLAIFFEELASRVEGKAPFVRGQKREKELRAFPHGLDRSRHLRGVELFLLQHLLNVAGEFVHAQVADGNSEVVSGDVFQFVGFVENHRATLGENASVGSAFGFEFDGEVGKEEMVVDDDDVALGGASPHLGDEATFVFVALRAEARIGAGVELVPDRAGLGQFGKFGAVSGSVSSSPRRRWRGSARSLPGR